MKSIEENERAYDHIYNTLNTFNSEMDVIRKSNISPKSKENCINNNILDLIKELQRVSRKDDEEIR